MKRIYFLDVFFFFSLKCGARDVSFASRFSRYLCAATMSVGSTMSSRMRDIVVIIALFDSSGPRNSWEGKINSDICTYCQAREPLLTNWSYLSVRRRANASAASHNKKQTPAVHSAGFGNAGCSPMWFKILSEN